MKILRILLLITSAVALAASSTVPTHNTTGDAQGSSATPTHTQAEASTPTHTQAEASTHPTPPPHYPVPTPPVVHQWNASCLIVKGAFQFTVNYPAVDGNRKTVINLPTNANFTPPICNGTDTSQQIASWKFIQSTVEITFRMIFNKSSQVFLAETEFMYQLKPALFPATIEENEKRTATNTSMDSFKVTAGNSWQCSTNTTMKIDANVTFTTSDVQVQAFADTKEHKFVGSVQQCSADQGVSYTVPIAVGAALAGLVLIILIAYVIGRTRNKKGYESV